MINRRSIFSLFGAGAAVAVTPKIAEAGIEKKPPTEGGFSLRLQRMIPKSNDAGFVLHEATGQIVEMKVGEDGYLWLKINDEWKRVKVE